MGAAARRSRNSCGVSSAYKTFSGSLFAAGAAAEFDAPATFWPKTENIAMLRQASDKQIIVAVSS